jgi:hypothetical protein
MFFFTAGAARVQGSLSARRRVCRRGAVWSRESSSLIAPPPAARGVVRPNAIQGKISHCHAQKTWRGRSKPPGC